MNEMNNEGYDPSYPEQIEPIFKSTSVDDEQPETIELEEILPVNRNSFFVSGEALLEMGITDIPYLVDPLLPQAGVVSVAGSSDIGKSSFLRQLGCAIATKRPEFLGYTINARYNHVIYVSTEDDKTAMAYLLHKQNVDGLAPSEYRNFSFVFDTDNLVHKLDTELLSNPADCVIIDTFTDIYGGDMNVTNKVRNFLTDYSTLANRHSCLFIFLHHTGKKTEYSAPSKNNLLGSQGFEAKMRLVIELRQDKTIPEHRHMCIVKGNYLPQEYKQDSYKLYFDENMLFTNTGERVPFEHLVGCMREDILQKPEYLLAVSFRREGFSYRKIVDKLNDLGYHVRKTTISKWVKQVAILSATDEESDVESETEE
jgi:hypothetical protein